MAEGKNQYHPLRASAPGETLEQILRDRAMSQADLATRTGRPKKTINEIVNGKAGITPETALQFEMVLGVPATFWMQRQQQFDEARARAQQNERLATAVEWTKELPIAYLQRQGWLPVVHDPTERARECLRFFGVASPQQWRERYGSRREHFRQSSAFEIDQGAVAAWLRRGEIEAVEIPCEPYGEASFRKALRKIRSLTRLSPKQFFPRMKALCASVGVALVVVDEVPKCRASGAALWLGPEKALIQLSLRFKTNDHFWFSFFHEAGHLLLHGKKEVFLDFSEGSGDMEEEANRFARDLLIPQSAYQAFLEDGVFRHKAVEVFASEIEIAPGIVVGRLQHDDHLHYSQLTDLKSKFRLLNGELTLEPR